MRALQLFAAITAFLPALATGDFHEARQVTRGAEAYERPRVHVGPLDEAYLVFQASGDVFLTKLTSVAPTDPSTGEFPEEIRLTNDEVADLRPEVGVNPGGLIRVVFETEDADTGDAGSDIALIDNLGGSFSLPQRFTNNAVPDRDPAITVTRDGKTYVAWSEQSLLGEDIVLYSSDFGPREFGPPYEVGRGVSPRIAHDPRGIIHFAYRQSRRILYRSLSIAGLGPEIVATERAGEDGTFDLAVGADRVPQIVYTSGTIVYHTYLDLDTNQFLSPANRITTMGSSPAVAAFDQTNIAIAYIVSGKALVRTGPADALEPAKGIPSPPGIQEVAIAVDSGGYHHVAMAAGGPILYTNDVPAPVAEFIADQVTGEVPVTVRFSDNSSGIIKTRRWDYGDGTTGTDPIHTYTSTGTYTVSLWVRGPGGESTKTIPGYIHVTPIGHRLFMPLVAAHPGQTGLKIPIYGLNYLDVLVVIFAIVYDPEVVDFHGISLAQGALGAMNPEVVVPLDFPLEDGKMGHVLLVMMEEIPTKDRRLKGSPNARLFGQVELDIRPDAPLGEPTEGDPIIAFRNVIGDPPNSNSFTALVDGNRATSIFPPLESGQIRIVKKEGELFRRGDVTFDGKIDLADAITLLVFIFRPGFTIPCLDSADVDDSGNISLGDVIYLLFFLFQSNLIVPYPSPAAGLDPTPDDLPPCGAPAGP